MALGVAVVLCLAASQASAARLPFKPGHYVGTTSQTCPPEPANQGLCQPGAKLPISFTITRSKIRHIRAVVVEKCEGSIKTVTYKMDLPGAAKIGAGAKRAAFYVRRLTPNGSPATNDLAAGYVKGRSAHGVIQSQITVDDEGQLDPNGDGCQGQGKWRASLSRSSIKSRRTLAWLRAVHPRPRVSWTLPQSVSEGQPIAFSWSARGRLGRKHRLVAQRQVGTAHRWKSVLRLRGRSGSAELPGLPLGRYRLRIADLVGRGRVLAKQVSGIGVFGQVPLGALLGAHEQVYSTSSFTFPYVLSHQIIGSEITALTAEHNRCNFVHVAFVPGKGYYKAAPGTVSVIQETRDPVSATTDKNTVGSLDAELVPGQSWSITETSSDVEPVFFFNGYAVCSSAKGVSG